MSTYRELPATTADGLLVAESEPTESDLTRLIEKLEKRYGLSFLGSEKRLLHFARDWWFMSNGDNT